MCYTGIVYAGTLDTSRYTFQASGSLWQDAMVMQDIETGSLWSQVSGEAIAGPLEGSRLNLFPSSMTTYEQFKQTYPRGLLLKKPLRGLPNSNYQEYFSDRTKLGIFGRVDKFRRLKGKELVIGVRMNDKQAAVTKKVLKKKGYARLNKLSPQVVITYDEASLTISAFSLAGLSKDHIDDLQFKDGQLSLKDSDISWNAVTGRLQSGQGDDLPAVPFTTAYWFAWISFFPDTDLTK